MKYPIAIAALVACTSALVAPGDGYLKVRDENTLEIRNSYELGVDLHEAFDCSDKLYAFRNHDESSCNAGTKTPNKPPGAVKVKDDGTSGGVGCMTVFQDKSCLQTEGKFANFNLNPNKCVSFKDLDFKVHCVVIGSGNGKTCDKPKDPSALESCNNWISKKLAKECGPGDPHPKCPGPKCYSFSGTGFCFAGLCQGPTPITNPLDCGTKGQRCDVAHDCGCCY